MSSLKYSNTMTPFVKLRSHYSLAWSHFDNIYATSGDMVRTIPQARYLLHLPHYLLCYVIGMP